MVREYVGARYVPKFMGTYDATQRYEALCVVDNGLGTSYISKIPTPAGTPLTNTTYWAVYGAVSGAIINLQNQIDDMKDSTVPGSLQNQISANTADINSLDTRVSDLERNERNTIVIFGDSWACNSPTQIPTYLANHFNAIVKNYAVAGTGFNVSGGYKDQLDYMTADPTCDLDDIKFAVIVCGLNDHYRGATADEFATMFNEWKALYNAKFNGRKIPDVYWFHNYSIENELTPSNPGGNPTDYWNQYRYYRTVRRSISGIKSCSCFGFVPGTDVAWQTDNYRHPSESGSTAYAENMCFVIDGAQPTIYPYQVIDGTFDTTVISDAPTLTITYLIRGNELYCQMNPAVKAISEVPTGGVHVIFNRYQPANIISGRDIGCGVQISAFDYGNKQITVAPNCSDIRAFYGVGSGRHVCELATGSLT